MTTWPGLRAAAPLEWMRVIRDGLNLPRSTKAVAYSLALHAQPDGTGAHPGCARLAWQNECSKSTILRALGQLERLGLLYCTERGSHFGVSNMASNYTLTLHDQLGPFTVSYNDWRKKNKPGQIGRCHG